MRLKDAARYFDDTPVYDGYTGEYLWDCQFSSFNDANAVGSTSTRRILSIAPGLQLPERRVIKVFDDFWLVGDGNPDSWRGEVIRQSFNMKKATDIVNILTPAQACLEAAGVQAYVQKIYFKDQVNVSTDADYDPMWNVFVAPGEPVATGMFLRTQEGLLRVRSAYLPLEDLRIAQSDVVDWGPTRITFQTGAYDPLADARSAGSYSTGAILIDFTKAFRYLARSSERVAAGDMNALVPKLPAFTPEPGQLAEVDNQNWRVAGRSVEGDAWLLHLRRA